GLALGSFLFGKRADFTQKPLRLYAILEGLIGLYALLMPAIFLLITRVYVWVHDAVSEDISLLMAVRFALCFVALLIPTTLMGGTLPVLTRFFVNREQHIGMGVGSLYSINTTGAVFGCFMAGFILIPVFGVSRTTWIAIAVNIGVAALALLISRIAPPPAAIHDTVFMTGTRKPSGPERSGTGYSPRSAKVVFWVIGFSGFAALGFEILWTRILIYSLGPSTYAFSAMLTTFLVGIALGSWLISRFTDRVKDPVSLLGFLELGLGLSTLLALLLIDRMINMQHYFSAFFQSNSWLTYMSTNFMLAFIFMFLPTFFMGAAFPVAAKIYSRGLHTIGKSVGNIYSINTVFGILGSLVTGFLLIPFLGLQRSMVALICLNLGLGAVLFLSSPVRGRATKSLLIASSLALLLAAFMKFEDQAIILRCKHLLNREKSQNFDILYCKEGVDASLAVIEGQKDGLRELNINGTSTAYSSMADLKVHRLLAHIPMATHPDPNRVLVIGFGMGVTSYGTLLYDVEGVDCVELVADEKETAAFFDKYNHNIFNDPRFHFIPEDGRNYALTTRNTYDVISMNAIHPSLAPSLYTHEFYTTCRDKMSSDGLMCVWLPTTMLAPDELRMLLKTFQDVFPGTTLWYNNPAHIILLGALTPEFTINFDLFRRRLERPEVQEDLILSGMADPYTFLSLLIMEPDGVREYTGDIPLNTDDRPYIEFSRSIECGFADEVLSDLYFHTKTDITRLLTHYGDSEESRCSVKHRFDLYNEAWPFMVEGELLMWRLPGKTEKQNAQLCFQ
ncbi:MAG: fused MFS/spermidine synthase, partial [Planctomycetota bacterium]